MKNIVSQKMSRGQGNELLNKLENAGLSDELTQKVIDSKNNNLAVKVVKLIQDELFAPSTAYCLACSIMGKNFFGVEEAIKYFGIDSSERGLAILTKVPWSEEVLMSVKDTHILVAVFPMSILEIRNQVDSEFFQNHEDSWYMTQTFANETDKVNWQLIHKLPVTDFINKTWDQYQAILSAANEYVPKARVMVYTIIGYYLATGERLFANNYIRCSDIDSRGNRVYVGGYDKNGLRINGWHNNRFSGDLGIAIAMK